MTATEITAASEQPAPRSSIQVERNSRGFNWTAKLYQQSADESDEALIARIRSVVAELHASYGGES